MGSTVEEESHSSQVNHCELEPWEDFRLRSQCLILRLFWPLTSSPFCSEALDCSCGHSTTCPPVNFLQIQDPSFTSSAASCLVHVPSMLCVSWNAPPFTPQENIVPLCGELRRVKTKNANLATWAICWFACWLVWGYLLPESPSTHLWNRCPFSSLLWCEQQGTSSPWVYLHVWLLISSPPIALSSVNL